MFYKIVFVVIYSLFAIQICTGENHTNTDGQTDDGSTTKFEKSALEKGMEPVFRMCHNFLDLVLPHNFYSKSDTAFNANVLAQIIKDNDYGRLSSDWRDVSSTFGGYAACIVIGFLFVLFMPIVGCIYCCCHCCCHKCGGTKEMMDPKHAVCKRWTFTILLLICSTFMLAGSVIVFLGSDMLNQSLANEDNKGLVGRMDAGLNDFQTFVNDSLKSIDTKVTDTVVKDGLDKILPEVEGAASRTVKRIKDTINATELLDEASKLGEAAETIGDNLAQLKPILHELKESQTQVSSTLQNVNSSVHNACGGISNQACDDAKSQVKLLSFKPDFSQLDDLETQAGNINQSQNIKTLVEQASASFNNVSGEIDSKVQTQITEAKNEIQKINTTVYDQVKDLKGKADPLNDEVKKIHDSVNGDSDETLKEIAKYVWYSCIGIGCAVIIVVFFYYMGVLYGLCGERPGHRAACCNRETGANILCIGICCSFLFAWLLMIVVILLFTSGGLLYSLTCKYTNDGVENIGDLETVLSNGFEANLSSALGFKGTSNLTITGMLRDCKDNKGIYSAFHLDNLFDIDKEFNVSDVVAKVEGIRSKLNEIANIGKIELLTPSLKGELDKLKQGSIANVNFSEYTEQLTKPVLPADVNLTALIQQLRDAATVVQSDPSKAAELNNSANNLTDLKDSTIPAINNDMAKLRTIVLALENEASSTVSRGIDNLIVSINKSENAFNVQAIPLTREELNKTVDDIKALVVETVDKSKYQIKNEVGKCRPLYDGIQTAVDSVCVATLDPMNAIWFGLGWSLFFYIPCFIFAALLSSLYKRSEKYKNKNRDFDDPIIRSHHEGDNGYSRGRHDDNVPLTSVGKDDRLSANGAYNYGYQG